MIDRHYGHLGRGEVNETSAEELIALSRMIAASPALCAREQQILARYAAALAQLIAEETAAKAGDLRPYVVANALIDVHRALILYVRDGLATREIDRRRLARQVRQRGDEVLALIADGVGNYAAKR